MESARQMREAADAMRRAAAGGDANASAQAQAALERLRETERRLQQGQSARAERDIQDAIRQAEELARRQEGIADDVDDLAALGASSNRRQQAAAINTDKEELETKLNALEQQLDRAARDASKEERAASRKMAEAAGSIRDNRLADKVRYSRNLVNRGASPQAFQATENEISGGIQDLRDKLQEAAKAVGQGGDNANRMETALDRARRLARGAESMQERLREQAEAGQQARNGQGQQGEQGPNGQAGEQGRDGQTGQQQGQNGQQQGQNGQRGQGQGQGQQGQQGQSGSQGSGGADGAQGQGQSADARGSANGQAGGGGAINDGGGFGLGFDGWWRNGRLSEEAIRQMRGEVRQFTGEAAELRRMLNAENLDPRELDEILRALRQLDDPRVYQNVTELQRLQSQVAEGLKRFEFGLRRQVDADGNTVVLSGTDEVPEQFRKLVEQYYRSLAKPNR
jgi:hypothetical protein